MLLLLVLVVVAAARKALGKEKVGSGSAGRKVKELSRKFR